MASKRLIVACRVSGRRIQTFLWTVLLMVVIAGCSAGSAGVMKEAPSFSPFSGLVSLYRGPLNHLAAVRHGECPMAPTCSEYAREAVDKHGEVMGWIMASDRLMRCGRDEMHLAPKINIDGEWRYYDPVERNDFWWSGSAPRENVTVPRMSGGDVSRSSGRP